MDILLKNIKQWRPASYVPLPQDKPKNKITLFEMPVDTICFDFNNNCSIRVECIPMGLGGLQIHGGCQLSVWTTKDIWIAVKRFPIVLSKKLPDFCPAEGATASRHALSFACIYTFIPPLLCEFFKICSRVPPHSLVDVTSQFMILCSLHLVFNFPQNLHFT